MGRMKRTDTHFHFRAEAEDMEWFKAYCRRNGTTASEKIRAWIQQFRRKDESARQQGTKS